MGDGADPDCNNGAVCAAAGACCVLCERELSGNAMNASERTTACERETTIIGTVYITLPANDSQRQPLVALSKYRQKGNLPTLPTPPTLPTFAYGALVGKLKTLASVVGVDC